MSATRAVAVEVPDIGDFADVPVIEILVSPGDSVNAEDPLLTLESDKATMDVPAPFAGVVGELQVKVGDKVSQGTPLLTLEPSSSNGAPAEAAPPAAPATEPPSEPAMVEETPDSQGKIPQAPPARDVRQPQAEDVREPQAGDVRQPQTDGAGAIYASPSVRRLARERGIDLRRVTGTGRKGRITKDDLERGVGGAPSAAPAGAVPGLNLAPWPSIDFAKQGPIERVERTRIQKIAAPNLARNWVMIPHVTHNDDADITELEAWRKQLNDEQARAPEPVKVTMVAFLVVASVATLKEFSNFNSSLDGDDLILKHYYNIGFAADTPGGLVVPVIKDADKKGLLEIAAELTELSGKARAGKLGPADISGSTFTISSLGGIGGTSFTPIVNAPEVAILGATRSAIKPVWNGSEFVPRLMLPLSLSYDHRVIDGAAAARFVVHLAQVLSDLRRALL